MSTHKKYLLFIVTVCIYANTCLNAAEFAIDKGSVLINGSVSLSSTKTSYLDYYGRKISGSSVYTARLTPNVGVFITKGLILGPALDLTLIMYKSYTQVVAGYGFKTAYFIGVPPVK